MEAHEQSRSCEASSDADESSLGTLSRLELPNVNERDKTMHCSSAIPATLLVLGLGAHRHVLVRSRKVRSRFARVRALSLLVHGEAERSGRSRR